MPSDPSSPDTNESDYLTFRELTTTGRIIKTGMGFAFFLAWLMLFVFGISLKAETYHQTFISPINPFKFNYLWLYAATFTPTNVAMLAALAGVLGGFASNLAADNQFRHLRPKLLDPKSEDFESYMYMTENPLVSMLRGFITYLIFDAGSYLTNFASAADPDNGAGFVGLTASSYFKFAISVSLLAYLAGYDPSRMKSLINSINIGRKDPAPPTQETVLTVQTTKSIGIAETGVQPVLNGQAEKNG